MNQDGAAFRHRPTKVVVVVLVGLILLLQLRPERLHLGFLVVVLGAAVLDVLVARRRLSGAEITVSAVRTVATPAAPLTLLVRCSERSAPVLVRYEPSGPSEAAGDTVAVGPGHSVTISRPYSHAHVARFLRWSTETTTFGLVTTTRWQARRTVHELVAAPPAEPVTATAVGFDELARIRPYVAGDRPNLIAWGATARTGELQVRSGAMEMEQIVVALDLGPPSEVQTIEAMLALAATYVGSFLDQGIEVRLVTRTTSPDYIEAEADRALADPSRSPTASVQVAQDGTLWNEGICVSGEVVDEVVTDHDDLTRRLARAEMGAPLPALPDETILIDQARIRRMRERAGS